VRFTVDNQGKLKHWCGSPAGNGPEASPVLEFYQRNIMGMPEKVAVNTARH
jgi:hypothetical protein